jgi:Protein of unknown function (DUF3768)
MNSTFNRIAALNDAFRKTGIGGKWLITRGIATLPSWQQLAILQNVCAFNAFDESNDPYGEHDFGAFEHRGWKIFWKIDYYDSGMAFASPDPSDPAQTVRVLTVMLAEEY